MQGGDAQQPPGANHPRPTAGISRRVGSSLDRLGGRSLNYLGSLSPAFYMGFFSFSLSFSFFVFSWGSGLTNFPLRRFIDMLFFGTQEESWRLICRSMQYPLNSLFFAPPDSVLSCTRRGHIVSPMIILIEYKTPSHAEYPNNKRSDQYELEPSLTGRDRCNKER